jgi:hypothetical protein
MANFIFNQAAALAAGNGLNWINAAYDVAVYDNTVSPARDSLWANLEAGVVARQELTGRVLTSFGACAANPVVFNTISPTSPGGFLVGLIILRASDNLLVAHIDSGLAGMNIQASALTYTFTVSPGANNEQAWFRL